LPEGELLSISLGILIDRLPEGLRAKASRKPAPNVFCKLPLRLILEQLPKGAVKLPFGLIRSGSPAGVFASQTDADTMAVAIPLELLLPVIPPGALARRPGQKKAHIPSEIGALFGPEAAKPAAISQVEEEPAAPETEPEPTVAESFSAPAIEPEPAAPETPERPEESTAQPDWNVCAPGIAPETSEWREDPAPIPLEPAPIPFPAPPAFPSASPIRSVPEPQPTGAIEPEPALAPAAPIPMPSLSPTFRQNAESVSAIRPGPAARPAPAPLPRPPAPVPPPVPQALAMKAPPSSAVPTAGSDPVLTIPLQPLMEQWPVSLFQALSEIDPSRYTVELPLSELEAQIARGRIAFSWEHLCQWMRPPLPHELSSLPLESPLPLPLNAVVPLFMARRGKPAARKQVFVEPSIPNLFAGTIPTARTDMEEAPSDAELRPVAAQPPAPLPSLKPALKPAPPAQYIPVPPTPLAPAKALSSTPGLAAAPAMAPSSGDPVPDLSVVFGQPGKKMWTPMEIVQKTAKLPGISGALVALQDGLLVASELPGTLNGENLAAFLPQMFARMGHYTRELKMSEPSSLMLVVNQIPFQVFKAGNVFFLAYGRSGSPLPGLQLQAVAAQLERQSQTT
jgi:predicted regulator of Ras-like GTPase activity (Roadblock/LC7/MglB family)